MSKMLAGAAWAILAMMSLTKKRWQRMLIITAFFAISFAQALTAGRMGYVTWGMIGLIMCLLRWRKLCWTVRSMVLSQWIRWEGVLHRA